MISRRHDSFGPRRRRLLFASLCAISFTFALVFAAFGAWMVLPYSALEMAVLFYAFRCFERHAGDWERVELAGESLIVESERAGKRSRQEFNRQWARVEVALSRAGAPRLAIRYAGRLLPIGQDLGPAEQVAMAHELKRLLGRG